MEVFNCNVINKSILDTTRVLVCISCTNEEILHFIPDYPSFSRFQNQPQVLRAYGFLIFLLQQYLGEQATFLLTNSNFAPGIYLYIYLLIYLFIYLFMYLFVYLCMNVSIYLFSIQTENLKCDRRTLELSLLGC